MNKEQTEEAIKVMQAYVDGKQIQWFDRHDESWADTTVHPQWNWDEKEYRVKPEPRKVYMVEVNYCPNEFYEDYDMALRTLRNEPMYNKRIATFVEQSDE